MSYELREIGFEQEEEIKTIIRTAFDAAPWFDNWTDEDVFHQYLLDGMGNKNSVSLGLYDGEELIALALGRTRHWFNGTELFIDDFCVKPGMQGKGCGSALIEKIRLYAGTNGYKKVSLMTFSNAPAYDFYIKNGMPQVEHKVVMSMEIH